MERKLRVLFISDAGDSRGAQKTLLDLIEQLMEDYQIEPILITKKKNKLNQWCDDRGIENYAFWYRYSMMSSPYDLEIINMFKHVVGMGLYVAGFFAKYRVNHLGIDFDGIDVIHTNTNRVDLGEYLHKKYGIPHVMHIREYGIEDFRNVIYRVRPYQYYNCYTTKFIAISRGVARAWAKRGLQYSKIKVIYDGIPVEKYKNIENQPDESRFGIAVAGAINKFKGQIQVVEALNLLPDEMKTHIKVYFFGNGKFDYIKKMKNKIKEYGLEEQFAFRGYVDNLPEELAKCQIGITPSNAEGFGLVTIEYILSGLCVIASDAGANVEIIKDNETGYLYRLGNSSNLASKIEYLYNHREEMIRVRDNAAEDVKERFNMRRNAEQTYHLYQSLLK